VNQCSLVYAIFVSYGKCEPNFCEPKKIDSHSSQISHLPVNHGSKITSATNFASILDRVNDSVYRVKDHHVKNNEKSTQINKLSIFA
jgi:hypothetical protein